MHQTIKSKERIKMMAGYEGCETTEAGRQPPPGVRFGCGLAYRRYVELAACFAWMAERTRTVVVTESKTSGKQDSLKARHQWLDKGQKRPGV